MHDLIARQDPQEAAGHISEALRTGNVMLMLGAGVSKGIGLPMWDALVADCRAAVKLSRKTGDTSTLMDEVRDHFGEGGSGDAQFAELVKAELYKKLAGGCAGDYTINESRSPLLIALGVVGYAQARHSTAEIFTLNFDDVLEAYLVAHAYRVQVATSAELNLRGDVDAQVLHPHGYLPRGATSPRAGTDLVFTREQYEKRLSQNPDAPWPSLIISRFGLRPSSQSECPSTTSMSANYSTCEPS